MNHHPLWAPWRLGYILGEEEQPRPLPDLPPGADPDSFICRAAVDPPALNAGKVDEGKAKSPGEHLDRHNLVIHRDEHCVTILNRYPYNNGHLLIAPRAHKAQLGQLDDAETLAAQRLLARWVDVLTDRMRAEGFNVGLNLGKVAGAGLPGHLHWHIVPRWNGDTNFMPALAAVKVIPQSLEALWELLHDAARQG